MPFNIQFDDSWCPQVTAVNEDVATQVSPAFGFDIWLQTGGSKWTCLGCHLGRYEKAASQSHRKGYGHHGNIYIIDLTRPPKPAKDSGREFETHDLHVCGHLNLRQPSLLPFFSCRRIILFERHGQHLASNNSHTSQIVLYSFWQQYGEYPSDQLHRDAHPRSN